MATINLTSAFNTNDFSAARTGNAILEDPSEYRFLSTAGYYVKVTGSNFLYTGHDPLSGTYTGVTIYSDLGFTAEVATFSSAAPLDFSTFFTDFQADALGLADTFTGSTGADTINGHDGADTIDGRAGNDAMTGGEGADIFKASRGNDTISDFGWRVFTAHLDAAQQPAATPSTSTATATASLFLKNGGRLLELSLVSTGLDFDQAQTGDPNDDVTGFHIHAAAAGVNGGIVWDIAGDAQTVPHPSTGEVTSSWTAAEGLTANLAALFTEGLYVNIHTTEFPSGAIRGQVEEDVDSGPDKIDLTALNIGSFAAWQAVTADVGGSARMTVFLNGIASMLTITNTPEATFTAADFIFAGNVAQTLNGTGGIDTLFGAGGNDHLNGRGGNDRLFGENDVDTIVGGLGRDTMTGGAARDIFDFNGKAETGKTAATRDIITDFQHLTDDVDVSTIDANGAAPGNTAFKFLAAKGAAFTGVKGQIHWFQQNPAGTANDKTIIEGDIDGNRVADFQIELSGLKTLSAADFLL